jgi:hypothetical protein
MTSPKKRDGKAPREEFEMARDTKELGRSPQRKKQQRPFNDFADSHINAVAHHGEDPDPESNSAPPKEDRAG